MSNDEVAVLEVAKRVAVEWGIEPADVRPCAMLLLDGNISCERHVAAFVLSLYLRQLGWDQERVQGAMALWARKIGWSPRKASRTVQSAFQRQPSGSWRYFSPGLRKKPGTRAHEALAATCELIGCPAHCPAFASQYSGPISETFKRFVALGWPAALRRRRWRAAVDVYRALSVLERRAEFAPGAPLLSSYRVIAEIAEIDHTTVGDALRQLSTLGLIEFEAGSGSGPHARDRKASRIRRIVPIPRPPGASISPAITTGGERRHQIGGR